MFILGRPAAGPKNRLFEDKNGHFFKKNRFHLFDITGVNKDEETYPLTREKNEFTPPVFHSQAEQSGKEFPLPVGWLVKSFPPDPL